MNANQFAGEYIIKVDGESLAIRFDAWALIALERELNIKIGSKKNADPFALGFTGFFALIWAGLLWKNPDLTLREVSKRFSHLLSDIKEAQGVRAQLIMAYSAAFGVDPNQPEAAPKNAERLEAGTGTSMPSKPAASV